MMKTIFYSIVGVVALGVTAAHSSSVMVRDAGLVPYEIVDDVAIPKSLTGVAGDAVNGRKVAISRKKGNCLACHAMPIPEQQFHGETAPTLYGVGNRLNEGELRLQLVNSKVTNDSTMMPSFYRTFGYNRPLKKFAGKSILTAQEVEDVVAYLKTLKTDQ
ncbi:MAG: sulfur oxidation c-type cytochrome SoxX [Alphaproteobacteria bacterium]|nr:sulfur oxidation c-type cytochrome SoxX [Alphaproteobacteria bacterium]